MVEFYTSKNNSDNIVLIKLHFKKDEYSIYFAISPDFYQQLMEQNEKFRKNFINLGIYNKKLFESKKQKYFTRKSRIEEDIFLYL